jgi:hypothetical protein
MLNKKIKRFLLFTIFLKFKCIILGFYLTYIFWSSFSIKRKIIIEEINTKNNFTSFKTISKSNNKEFLPKFGKFINYSLFQNVMKSIIEKKTDINLIKCSYNALYIQNNTSIFYFKNFILYITIYRKNRLPHFIFLI